MLSPEFAYFDNGVFDLLVFDLEVIDHCSEAKIPEQFKGQPNYEGLISVICARAGKVNDEFIKIQIGRFLASAIGETLDRVGRDLGERRNGRTDQEYRDAIYVRVAINNANGSIARFLEIAALLSDNPSIFKLEQLAPASIRFHISGVPHASSVAVARSLASAVPVGVQAFITAGPNSGYFGWADDPSASGWDTFPMHDGTTV